MSCGCNQIPNAPVENYNITEVYYRDHEQNELLAKNIDDNDESILSNHYNEKIMMNGGINMSNEIIVHFQKYAKKNKMTFNESLSNINARQILYKK